VILPRDDYYLAVCSTCEWYIECDRAPFKAQRIARTHALRRRQHRTVILNMTRLDTVACFYYEPIAQLRLEREDQTPPF